MAEWSTTICDIIYDMARKWTKEEEEKYRKELYDLYITQNKTIGEIAVALKLDSYKTVYDRLKRLQIKTCREKKAHCNNKRTDITLPKRSCELAELMGVLLGDGSVTHFQIWVTLGTKEMVYAKYVLADVKAILRHYLWWSRELQKRASHPPQWHVHPI